MRNEQGEYQLTPAYDLISTVVHTPLEADTALDLYPGDMDSAYYLTYGHYGRSDFIELASRLGILEIRAERMLDEFLRKESAVYDYVERSFLSQPTKEKYIASVADKLKRLTRIS